MDPITGGLIFLGKFLLGKAGVGAVSSAVAGAVGAGAVIAVVGALVYIRHLVMSDFRSFFRDKNHYKNPRTHRISFKAELQSKKKVYVQAFTDDDGDLVADDAARTIEYNTVSSEVEELHDDGKIVEYT